MTQEEEGICTGKLFSEHGLIGLMEQAAALFKEAQHYEAVSEVYKIILPVYEARRSHQDMEKVHRKLADCYRELVQRGENRFLGSYFRVGFYGLLFGTDLDQKEFIYKEAGLTRLGEFSLKLQVGVVWAWLVCFTWCLLGVDVVLGHNYFSSDTAEAVFGKGGRSGQD